MSNRNRTIKNKQQENKSPRWFYLILILLPVIFVFIIEISLRVFGYGEDYKTFTPLSKDFPNRLALNPRLTLKYFTNLNNYPTPLADSFLKEKTNNTFRIFVLGGSSAEGWPYTSTGSFPANLKRRLELSYPTTNIEVINCGISAINTYTIRDIVPDIIEEKPDLILFYGGHNEYYGALGVGSTVSMGSSRALINFYISISNFRTVQLLNKVISNIYSFFTNSLHSDNSNQGTLMSRVIGKSKIILNSQVFNEGVKQFEGNLDDILKYFKKAKIPVILGELTSNILDQKPFVSIRTKELPRADIIYDKGKIKFNKGNIKTAHKLLLWAKELDALRFRAPNIFNMVISKLAKKYNYPVIDINSIFESNSPKGIVGYNLTVDHLHPNLKGYKLIAKSFYLMMKEEKLLPNAKKKNLSEAVMDSILDINFPFTRFDSTIAQLKLNILTGSFPFVPKGTPNYKMINFRSKNYSDSLALQFVKKKIFWQRAHVYLADRYYKEKKYDKFEREMKSLITMLPFDDTPYEYTARHLINAQLFDRALNYLIKLETIKPSYYVKKWLGAIYLQKGKYSVALKYLEEASKFSDADTQLWYNLAGAYFYNNKLNKAIKAAETSLRLNPRNTNTSQFLNQLKEIKKSNKN